MMVCAPRARLPFILILALLGLLVFHGAGGIVARSAEETQTQPVAPPGESAEPPAEFPFELAPTPGVPEEYLDGISYLGSYREAWRTEALLDPVLGKIFLALQDGATRQELEKLEIPDLDLALTDLTTSRMIRKVGEIYRPAFPVIHGEAASAFSKFARQTAESIYPDIRPYLKKAKKAAKREKVSPWLFDLAWAEVFDSRSGEEMLTDAGVLDARRLRDEGYLWIQIPADSCRMGVDRYGSGSETLYYVWTPISLLNPVIQDFPTQRRILDGALGHLPWTDPLTEEGVQSFGILDPEKKVAVPSLKKGSELLAVLRQASQLYVKRALASLRSASLAESLKVPRDEAFAVAFATLGFRMMEMAGRDGWFRKPEYLALEFSPSSGLVEALVVTPDEMLRPLDRAYYLYDQEDFTGSIQLANEYLKSRPGDPEALFRLGIAFMKLRKYPEALEAFERGIALPASAEDVWRGWLLIRAGNTLDMLNRRDDALLRYEQALGCFDVNSSHETARLWLENVYRD